MSLRFRGALVAPALLVLGACADDATAPAAPGAARGAVVASALRADRLATVEWEGRFPRLYLQDADGSRRTRVVVGNVHDKIDGNWPAEFLPVNDNTVIAMSNPVWSPDGQQLAVVVSVAYDQSQVIVMNADGRQLRTESINGQSIMGRVDWSPDSRRIAWVMSTQARGQGVDLFVTDLVTETVQRLTTDGRFRATDQYRWDESGRGIWFTNFERWSDDGWNRIARVYHATLTGQVTGVPVKLEGDLMTIARDGRWALSVRYDREGAQSLVRLPMHDGGETTVLAEGMFTTAFLLEGDREAIVGYYGRDGSDTFASIDPATGTELALVKVPRGTSSFGVIRAGR